MSVGLLAWREASEHQPPMFRDSLRQIGYQVMKIQDTNDLDYINYL